MDDCIFISDDEDVVVVKCVVNLEPILIDLTNCEEASQNRSHNKTHVNTNEADPVEEDVDRCHDTSDYTPHNSPHSSPQDSPNYTPRDSPHYTHQGSPYHASPQESPRESPRESPQHEAQMFEDLNANIEASVNTDQNPTQNEPDGFDTRSSPYFQMDTNQNFNMAYGADFESNGHATVRTNGAAEPDTNGDTSSSSNADVSPNPEDDTNTATNAFMHKNSQVGPAVGANNDPIMSDHDLMLAQKALGNEKYKHNLFDDAIRTYRRANELAQRLGDNEMSSILHFNLAMTYYKLGSYDQAAGECANAVKLNDNYIKAHLKRAEIYQRQRKFDEAVICYEHVCELDSKNQDYAILLQHAKEVAKKSRKKDWHEILGLNSNSTLEDLKRAYRKLALILHPDRHSNADIVTRKIKEKKFKEVSEARSYLESKHASNFYR